MGSTGNRHWFSLLQYWTKFCSTEFLVDVCL